jgi:hypothetical protein
MKLHSLALLTSCLLASTALAQDNSPYNDCRGKNRVMEDAVDEEGKAILQKDGSQQRREVRGDKWGNAQGSQYDLAVDGAFEGQTVAVLQLAREIDFSRPKAALKQKGFSVYRWMGAPSPEELKTKLSKACQLWILSGTARQLNDKHLAVIKEFYESGRGLYIWGDNDPYYADANFVGKALIGTTMTGNLPGAKTVGLQETATSPGILPNHLLSTGLQSVYEGITIATIQSNQTLTPLIYGSANNLVAAFSDTGGKRVIFDGGFTRLYCAWDNAGTGRYIRNAAAWLANVERFGDDVVGKKTPAVKKIPENAK